MQLVRMRFNGDSAYDASQRGTAAVAAAVGDGTSAAVVGIAVY